MNIRDKMQQADIFRKKVYESYKKNPNQSCYTLATKFSISHMSAMNYIAKGLKNKW